MVIGMSKLKAIEWDGKTITKPGLYARVPLSLYHSQQICDGPSISSSGLRTIFNESPAHFYVEWDGNPERIERKDSRAFILGRATHHLVLGEKFFSKLFCMQPTDYVGEDEKTGLPTAKPWNNNAKACRAWQEARRKEGRTVLTAKEVEQIKGMATKLALHPIIRAGALNGQIERSIFWVDKKTGIWLKSRPDCIPEADETFVDLKKTRSVIWNDLVRTIGEYSYHQQGALILRAAREVLGMVSPTFTLVFCEDGPPYAPRVVTLKENDLALGDAQNRAAIDIFARCLKSGQWPGPGGDHEDAEHLELSDFEQKRIKDKLTIMGAG